MLKMKETRASILNDFMMGTVPTYKMEEHMKSKLSSEEDEINSVIKPEYLKNSALENVSVSFLFLIIKVPHLSQRQGLCSSKRNYLRNF